MAIIGRETLGNMAYLEPRAMFTSASVLSLIPFTFKPQSYPVAPLPFLHAYISIYRVCMKCGTVQRVGRIFRDRNPTIPFSPVAFDMETGSVEIRDTDYLLSEFEIPFIIFTLRDGNSQFTRKGEQDDDRFGSRVLT